MKLLWTLAVKAFLDICQNGCKTVKTMGELILIFLIGTLAT